MGSLTRTTIRQGYKSLLRVDDNSNGIDAVAEVVTDGLGNKSALKLSDDQVIVAPQNDDTTTALRVRAKSGDTIFAVDTTNSVVKAGANAMNVHTHYAYFGCNYIDFSNAAANTHYPIPFSAASGGGTTTNDVDFGTGTDPNTTFTTANIDTQYASQIVPCMMYVPDNISIDAVHSIEGADAATGDTTRFHLMSFVLNSGSTSCLTDGTIIASSSDESNAGNEQAYLNTWSINSASVTSGKVLLAFLRSDSVNSDYSLNITIKYHLV